MAAPAIRIAMLVVLSLVLLYGLALVALAIGQRSFMYFPTARVVPPAEVGLPQAQVLHLKTDDGETLLAWFIPPAQGRPLILYFHGNADGLEARNLRFQKLTETGDGLLAIAYRGYAGSSGTPTEEGLHRDAEAAYAQALALGVSPGRIVAMGESLGTGVAVALAARHEMGALVLDSPYSSAADVGAAQFWMFPVRWLMRDPFRSDKKIGAIYAPLLLVHGSNDRVIPIWFGEKLFALANPPKRFIRVDGASHLALGEVIPEVLAWIDEAMAARPKERDKMPG